jgi:hypothetical protein
MLAFVRHVALWIKKKTSEHSLSLWGEGQGEGQYKAGKRFYAPHPYLLPTGEKALFGAFHEACFLRLFIRFSFVGRIPGQCQRE